MDVMPEDMLNNEKSLFEYFKENKYIHQDKSLHPEAITNEEHNVTNNNVGGEGNSYFITQKDRFM